MLVRRIAPHRAAALRLAGRLPAPVADILIAVTGASRHCVFCGETATLTLEHVLPHWMVSDEATGNNTIYVRESGGPDHEPFRDARRGPSRDLKAKAVCEACNSGWMQELDNALHVLGPQLLKGKTVHLAKGKQQALAKWAAKFAFTLQLVYPRGGRFVIPAADYRLMGDGQLPGEGMRLWVGYMEPPGKRGGPVLGFAEHRHDELFYDGPLLERLGLDPALACKGYSATIRFGYCVIGLLRLPHPELLAVHALGSPRQWVAIWPAVGTRSCPPREPMTPVVGLSPRVAGRRPTRAPTGQTPR